MPAARPSKWNPYQVRRCVRFDSAAPDGVITFKSKSFSKPDENQDVYHPAVDLQTGAVTCDCPHFTYRLAKHAPTIHHGDVCKHVHRVLDNLKRKGVV